MKKEKVRCAFSVKYQNPDYPDEIWAADWDWYQPRQWSRSWCPAYGIIHWHPEPGLDKIAWRAILEKFGLWPNFKEELPLDKVKTMSPAKLVAFRRKKERILGLPRLKIISDTFGDPRPAEQYH